MRPSPSGLPVLPVLSRRDITHGLFGNVSDADASLAESLMDEILVMGYQNVVVAILFGE